MKNLSNVALGEWQVAVPDINQQGPTLALIAACAVVGRTLTQGMRRNFGSLGRFRRDGD
jgi:hypothetical protein